jgi:hypothetical protein
MKILFIVPYPTGQAASQRFRFEHYYNLLKEKNIAFTVSPLLTSTHGTFYTSREIISKSFLEL